jgi:hypothetical protein
MIDRPNIVASLIWYDESPAWLAATLHGILPHITHLVAIDGAYGLYPQGKNWSRPDQHEIIIYSCQSAGVGLTLHTPPIIWLGNEVEKRTWQLDLALRVAEPMQDWVMIVDSDEVVINWPPDTHDRLAGSDLNVAEVSYVEHHPRSLNPDQSDVHFNWGADASEGTTRNLFRALPDLRMGSNHYTVHGGNRTLRGNMSTAKLDEAVDLKDLKLDHRTHLRARHRHDSQYEYYRRRDTYGIEAGRCHLCDKTATQYAQKDWENVGSNGQWELAAGWMEVCADCKVKADEDSERTSRALTDGAKGLADMTLTKGKVPH